MLRNHSFTDTHSTVRTIELPVGKYYLIGWHPNPYEITIKSPVFEFEVKNGSVSYIGNIYYNGVDLIWSSKYKARDFEYFKSKNSSFLHAAIDEQNINTNIKFRDFKVKGIIWDVP